MLAPSQSRIDLEPVRAVCGVEEECSDALVADRQGDEPGYDGKHREQRKRPSHDARRFVDVLVLRFQFPEEDDEHGATHVERAQDRWR